MKPAPQQHTPKKPQHPYAPKGWFSLETRAHLKQAAKVPG